MAKYITQGTIEKIIVNTQGGGNMRIQIAPAQGFRIEACGKTAIALAETNGNSWSVDLTKPGNSLLVPEDSEFRISNVSIAELITLKNNGNKIELRLEEKDRPHNEVKAPDGNLIKSPNGSVVCLEELAVL